MEKPAALSTLDLAADRPVNDLCEMAKRSYNSARRGKIAYGTLVFALALVVAVAAVYAVISFRDSETTRGIFGVIGSVSSLLVGGVFSALTKDAREDETAMWERVKAECKATPPGQGDVGA
ncbi:MAG: hypothetical protein K0R88_1318 [Solirubrobacterales bacterium]|nr:hypothetical protein [Solirubrobacterales bacterium]